MSDDSATAIKCPLCAVTVPADKVDLPNRCLHPRCPLHRDQSKWVRPSDKTFDGDDLGSTITLSSNAICATLWRRWIVQYARHASDASGFCRNLSSVYLLGANTARSQAAYVGRILPPLLCQNCLYQAF